MKIIEGLKKIKDLLRKAEDLRKKVETYCADHDTDTPTYQTVEKQTQEVAGWLQAHRDILKEVESLRLRVQLTNLHAEATVEVTDGVFVTKPIAAWIHRRKDLAKLEASAYKGLTGRGLEPRAYKVPGEDGVKIANVRRYYDQKARDQAVEAFTSEPARIDAALEVVNATTDLED